MVEPATEGSQVHVEATAEECAALAKDFKLPAIRTLAADYRLTGSAKGVHVEGQVTRRSRRSASSPSSRSIPTSKRRWRSISPKSGLPAESPTDTHENEPPDEIVNGQIDLGALTAEFLALGLDPYPRKPDADFQFEGGGERADSPFAALGKLKREG